MIRILLSCSDSDCSVDSCSDSGYSAGFYSGSGCSADFYSDSDCSGSCSGSCSDCYPFFLSVFIGKQFPMISFYILPGTIVLFPYGVELFTQKLIKKILFMWKNPQQEHRLKWRSVSYLKAVDP